MMHLSALKQASGEAKYIDDLPHFENELYAGLILSERAHAKFTLDTSGLDEMKVYFVYYKIIIKATIDCMFKVLNILHRESGLYVHKMYQAPI